MAEWSAPLPGPAKVNDPGHVQAHNELTDAIREVRDVIDLKPGASFPVEGFGADPTGSADSTQAIQAAIVAAVEAGGGYVDFQAGATYRVDGTPVAGSALGYNYSGQILFPAVSITNAPTGGISVVLRGGLPAPGLQNPGNPAEPATRSTAVIKSSATSGYIFDAIPGGSVASHPFTNIMVTLEDLCIRAPLNPQCGGFNGSALHRMRSEGAVNIDVESPGVNPPFPTGSLAGLLTPTLHGGAQAHFSGSLTIYGYPIAGIISEHAVFDNLAIQYCAVGIQPFAGGSHAIVINRMLVQRVPVVFQAPTTQPSFGGYIRALVDVEYNTAYPEYVLKALVDDPQNKIRGRLEYIITSAPTAGVPMVGGQQLNIANLNWGAVGWMEGQPYDTFKRIKQGNSPNENNIGSMDYSGHPWHAQGNWNITDADGLAWMMSGAGVAYMRHMIRGSRTVSARIKLSADTTSHQGGVLLGRNNLGNYAHVTMAGGKVTINKVVSGASSLLSSSADGVVAPSGTYDLTVLYRQIPGQPWMITALVDGVKVAEYSLSAAEMVELVDKNNPPTMHFDGIRTSGENRCRFLSFSVTPGIG